MALFRRALPYTDAKRLHLALLSILEASQLVSSLPDHNLSVPCQSRRVGQVHVADSIQVSTSSRSTNPP